MARRLLDADGFFVGASSAMHCCVGGRGRAEARAGAHDRYRALRWRPSLSRLAARATSTGCVREWHERPEVREREREQPAGVSQVGSHEPGRVHQGMRLEATVSDISLQYMQTSA